MVIAAHLWARRVRSRRPTRCPAATRSPRLALTGRTGLTGLTGRTGRLGAPDASAPGANGAGTTMLTSTGGH
jgi:hypothetical protein